MAANSFYTTEEDENYPTASQAEMVIMLPGRTLKGICVRASRLGVLKKKEYWEGQYIYLIQVVIANTSPKLHEWLESKMPGSGYVNKMTYHADLRPHSHPDRWKPSYRWIISGSRFAIVFLKEIAPYRIIKREQAELLINGYVHLSEDERDKLFQKLRDLKKIS